MPIILVFSRIRNNDKIIAGINLPIGNKEINVSSVFTDGQKINDFYSGQELIVKEGKVVVNSGFDIVLLEGK